LAFKSLSPRPTASSDGIDTESSDDDESSESMTLMDEKEQERESGCTSFYTNTGSDDSSVDDEEQQVDSPTSFLDDNMQSLPQTIELLRNLHATAANNRCEGDDGRSTASDSDNSSNTVDKNSEPLLP
jgi:hypothetical protein